jgi:hypothetical protein
MSNELAQAWNHAVRSTWPADAITFDSLEEWAEQFLRWEGEPDLTPEVNEFLAFLRGLGATHIDLSDGSLVRARHKYGAHYTDGTHEAGWVFDSVDADR